nr:PAS domain-containing protein [Hahella ganghwensis]
MAIKLVFKSTAEVLLSKVEKLLHQLLQDEENEDSLQHMQALIQELQTHQIELKVQNEELRINQTELSDTRDQYQRLYDCAPVAYLTLNQSGVILEANLKATELLQVNRNDLIGMPLTDYICPGIPGYMVST